MVDSSTSAVASRRDGFEELLEETVICSIRDLLGESSMKAIVYHLSLGRLAGDPGALHEKLHELLNAAAAMVEEVLTVTVVTRFVVTLEPRYIVTTRTCAPAGTIA